MSTICSDCGRWSTSKRHCYDAIITFLCIKKFTKVFDNIDHNVMQIIAKKLYKDAGEPYWQNACMTIKWMSEN